MKLTTWIHRPEKCKWTFKVKEWTCCGHVWQLLMSRNHPDRYDWEPTCPTCENKGKQMIKPELEIINTNLRRYTFESPKIKKWIETNASGKVLNLFAGKTKLDLDEIRNDVDETMIADYHLDALDFVKQWKRKHYFDTVILDPPYSYRKSMEMYNGNLNSRFKLIADNLRRILAVDAKVISFGYHSTFMGKTRNFHLAKMCVFAHGGSQHCTIAIIEKENKICRTRQNK